MTSAARFLRRTSGPRIYNGIISAFSLLLKSCTYSRSKINAAKVKGHGLFLEHSLDNITATRLAYCSHKCGHGGFNRGCQDKKKDTRSQRGRGLDDDGVAKWARRGAQTSPSWLRLIPRKRVFCAT